MLKDELTAVGAIFTLLVGSYVYLTTLTEQNKKIEELRQRYITASTLAVELNIEYKETKLNLLKSQNKIEKMEKDIEDVQVLIKIKDELRKYTIEEKAIGLAMNWSESSFRFNPDHNDDGFTVGFCGVTEYWIDYLGNIGIDRYSAAACIEIYKFYKEKHGSRYAAIKAYKGIKENTYLINHTLDLRNTVLKILKENK